MAHRAIRIGGRIAAGLGATAVAALLVGAAIALPGAAGPADGTGDGLLVTPEATDQERACPGPLLRVGDITGENATTLTSFGQPILTAAEGSSVAPMQDLDVVAADGGATSALVTAPPGDGGAALAAVQAQVAAEEDQAGLAVAQCAESDATSWLLAGATDTGRTSLLMLANPSAVDSLVDVALYTGDGAAAAPGLTDLVVPPGSQRVLSLAGFAPGAAGLAARVESRGGLIVPTLQHSVVRGLEPGGTELAGPTAPPAPTQLIPGVRVTTADAANDRARVGGSLDVTTVVRVFVPGNSDAEVTIGATSDTAGAPGTSVDATAPAGKVTDITVDGLGDGTYTITVQADVPIVASARVSTVAPPDPDAEPSETEMSFEIIGDAGDVAVVAGQRIDLAWFAAAAALPDAATFATAAGPSPRITMTSTSGAETEVVLTDAGGEAQTVTLGGGSTVSVELAPQRVYTLTGVAGVVAAVSYAGEGQLAATVVRAANPLSGAITVYR